MFDIAVTEVMATHSASFCLIFERLSAQSTDLTRFDTVLAIVDLWKCKAAST